MNDHSNRSTTSSLSGLPGAHPDSLADLIDHAIVVGLGTSTRGGREPFLLVEQATRALLQRGFGAIAVMDNQRVVELYDRFVLGDDVDIDAALEQAWGPWRTTEMRDALTWLRRHNQSRQNDPVRGIAIGSSRVLPTDYDRVVELLTGLDPATAARVGELFDVIRTAHEHGEHVLRARGTHPGTPFVDLARAARAMAAGLDNGAQRDEAVRLLDAMVEHHANAIGQGYDAEREERAAADRILRHHRRTGDRIVLWEGSLHIAAHRSVMLGSHLKQALGDRYAPVHVTFGQGRVPGMDIPPPREDSVEALALGGERTVDLRSQLATGFGQQWRIRLISGVYEPERDDDHYYSLPSLTASFDVVVLIPTITPLQPLTADGHAVARNSAPPA